MTSTRIQVALASNSLTIPLQRKSIAFTKARVRKLVYQPETTVTTVQMLQLRLGCSSMNQVWEADSVRACFFCMPLAPESLASYISPESHWDYTSERGHPQSLETLEIEALLDGSPLAMGSNRVVLELEFF